MAREDKIRIAGQEHVLDRRFTEFVPQLWSDDVSALSDARTRQEGEEVCQGRAFDKAVRRKPLAIAADAGLWE